MYQVLQIRDAILSGTIHLTWRLYGFISLLGKIFCQRLMEKTISVSDMAEERFWKHCVKKMFIYTTTKMSPRPPACDSRLRRSKKIGNLKLIDTLIAAFLFKFECIVNYSILISIEIWFRTFCSSLIFSLIYFICYTYWYRYLDNYDSNEVNFEKRSVYKFTNLSWRLIALITVLSCLLCKKLVITRSTSSLSKKNQNKYHLEHSILIDIYFL